jgi:NADH-quinone oxidoreductase subunit L
MIQLVYLVPLLPLIGFVIIGLFGKKLSKGFISVIGCGSVFGAFAIAFGVFLELNGQADKSIVTDLFPWIRAGTFQ